MRTYFEVMDVDRLRRDARRAAQGAAEGPEDWSKSDIDPMRLLGVFPELKLREGYVLRAYRFRSVDGRAIAWDGVGVVWAMPAGAPFPPPDECPWEDDFLSSPRPSGAVDFMSAIEGDGTPASYVAASLFAREAHALGALWRDSSSSQRILDAPPWMLKRSPEEWEWIGIPPTDWRPCVEETATEITVRFYSYSGLGRETVYENVDRFGSGDYRFRMSRKDLAHGPGGFLF